MAATEGAALHLFAPEPVGRLMRSSAFRLPAFAAS